MQFYQKQSKVAPIKDSEMKKERILKEEEI